LNPSRKIKLFNIHIDAITIHETLQMAEQAIEEKKQIHHTVVNAGKIVQMQIDKELEKSVVEADIINADGQAVVWAANFLGQKLPERVSGIDLMEKLVKKSHENKYKCFFFGAKEEVVTELVDIYKKQYSDEIIADYRNGYFEKNQEEEIANQIAASRANMLFVAITSPKKEIFLNTYKKQLQNINFIMGVGGSFDVIVGKIKRAPIWMQNIGLEWLFRFLQEPIRMGKRYTIGNIKFILLVIKEYFKTK